MNKLTCSWVIILIFFSDSLQLQGEWSVLFILTKQVAQKISRISVALISYMQGNYDNELPILGCNSFEKIIQLGQKIAYFTKFSSCIWTLVKRRMTVCYSIHQHSIKGMYFSSSYPFWDKNIFEGQYTHKNSNPSSELSDDCCMH